LEVSKRLQRAKSELKRLEARAAEAAVYPMVRTPGRKAGEKTQASPRAKN
jgi:hypothetical protein